MRPEFERHRLDSAASWFDELPAEIDADDAVHRMYLEWSLVALPDQADDEDRTVLQRFTYDPNTPEDDRRRAASWAEHGVYALPGDRQGVRLNPRGVGRGDPGSS